MLEIAFVCSFQLYQMFSNMAYKYTFLVPAYKIDYFEKALRSMIGQTYRNFKIIVSDDCSPMPLKSVFEKVVSESQSVLSEGQVVFKRNATNYGGGRPCFTLELITQRM